MSTLSNVNYFCSPTTVPTTEENKDDIQYVIKPLCCKAASSNAPLWFSIFISVFPVC